MPNEFSYAYLSGSSPQAHNLSVPGTVVQPTYRRRVLTVPLHSMTATQLSRRVQNLPVGDPRKYGTLWMASGGAMPPPGLGFAGAGFGVASGVAAAVTAFGNAFAAVVDTIISVIKTIVKFIVEVVSAVVQAVMAAVGSLLTSVVDMLTLKKDGSVSAGEAIQMGSFLYDKYNSLKKGNKPGELDRPMTAEENEGFERTMATSKGGIDSLKGFASSVVGALGGTTNTILLGAAAAGAVMFMGR